jgi:hypothetical protein
MAFRAPTNDDRAARIPAVLEAYAKARGGEVDADEIDIADLLADLMHYTTLADLDFQAMLTVAEVNYNTELAEEEN